MTKFKKTLLIIGIVLIIIPVITIIFISPITKYVVQKYSVKYTGRQIKMDWAYVNPFTGHVHFSNLKIYEANSDSIFFSSEGITVDFALRKLFSKTYEISSLVLDKPKGTLILNARNDFNFNDLIQRFSDTAKADTAKPPSHFNILNVKINNGIFYFHDTLIHVNYFIKNLNFETSGKRWDADTIAGKFSFSSGPATGDMNGNFTLNLKTLRYRYAVVIHKFDLGIIEQYLKDLTNYGTFSANLDADLKSTGNFKDENDQDTKGRIQVNDFHFGKSHKEDYLSFNKFVLAINEVDPKEHLYHLDSFLLYHPYFKYEKYDKLDNIQTMFGEKGGKVSAAKADNQRYNLIIELAQYIIDISKNFFDSEYKVNKLAIDSGDVKYNDYSTIEKFSMDANPFTIIADSVDKTRPRIKLTLQSGLQPYGMASVTAYVNPRDSQDFDLNYHFAKIPLAMFNPYLISLTSFPVDKGTIEVSGSWIVRKGVIQSDNHILILDPRVTKRLKNKGNSWIPTWLIMAFVREKGNVIDYSIPITGNLKSPNFHLHDVVFSTLKNIFVKPTSTLYRMEVKSVENDIEKSLTLKWELRQTTMLPSEQKFIGKIAEFLASTPAASIVISPQQYEVKEKEYILFFEAKKKYYLSVMPGKSQTLSEDDSDKIDKMSVKDSMFVHYLNKHLSHALVFTIQDKCSNIVSHDMVNSKFNQLNKSRENAFLSYFKSKGVENRVTFSEAKDNIPYNGFSYYKIDYKGVLPDFLLKAYKEMEDLNNEKPREEYKTDRGKIKIVSAE